MHCHDADSSSNYPVKWEDTTYNWVRDSYMVSITSAVTDEGVFMIVLF